MRVLVAAEDDDFEFYNARHRESRDDAAWFFVPETGSTPLRLKVLLRVTHAGEFHVLPARAGLMYFPRVHGASAEIRLVLEGR